MFDLVVIGGGILGAACAHRAAASGWRVAVIERGDFASAASSASSKLIHGGLRYLAQGRVQLVRESLRERGALLGEAFPWVRPLKFFLPIYPVSAWPAWKARAGLFFYDVLSGRPRLGASRRVAREAFLAQAGGIRSEGLRDVFEYWDAGMDDARLCLETLKRAWALSAVTANRVSVQGFVKVGGRVAAIAARDELTGETFEVKCRKVINAAGPWADTVRRLDEPGAPPAVRLTKGVHLVARRFGPREALLLTAPQDHRVFFVLPFGEDHTLIGTTDTPHEDPDREVAARGPDVNYLVEAVRHYFPGAASGLDVVSTFAGLRALVRSSGDPSSLSREEAYVASPSGVLTLIGGKYTTHRAIAAKALARLALRPARSGVNLVLCDRHAFETVRQAAAQFLEAEGVAEPGTWAERWASRYGLSLPRLIHLAKDFRGEVRPVCPHQPYMTIELRYAVREEMALGLEDLLRRRTRMALTACRGADVVGRAVAVLAAELGWDEPRASRELEFYRTYLSATAPEKP